MVVLYGNYGTDLELTGWRASDVIMRRYKEVINECVIDGHQMTCLRSYASRDTRCRTHNTQRWLDPEWSRVGIPQSILGAIRVCLDEELVDALPFEHTSCLPLLLCACKLHENTLGARSVPTIGLLSYQFLCLLKLARRTLKVLATAEQPSKQPN